MSKDLLKYLYIVEGKTDVDKLKKVGCEYVIETGGEFIRKSVLNFIVKASFIRKVILFLDPDGPGKNIENQLKSNVDIYKILYLEKKLAIKSNKVGVAQADINIIKDFLVTYIEQDLKIEESKLLPSDLIDLKIYDDKNFKAKIIDRFSIPYKTSKKILYCLNILHVSKNELLGLINEWERKNYKFT